MGLPRSCLTRLDNPLRPLRDYVNAVANGNKDIVSLSGFEASKVPSPIGNMPSVVITNGKKVRWWWERYSEVVFRLWCQKLCGRAKRGWSGFHPVAYPSKAWVTILGLTVGTFYWFRVAANGAAGLGPSGPNEGACILALNLNFWWYGGGKILLCYNLMWF